MNCELCGAIGDRWVTIEKDSGQTARLWTCPFDALFLAAPIGIDLLPGTRVTA